LRTGLRHQPKIGDALLGRRLLGLLRVAVGHHRLRYGHFVWHLFVISGTACHFLAVFWYAAGT